MVTALTTDRAIERKCVLAVHDGDGTRDMCMRVRAAPIEAAGEAPAERKAVVVFLQDTTSLERLSQVQRAFYHDLRNLVTALHGAADQLPTAGGTIAGEAVDDVKAVAARMEAEVRLQSFLAFHVQTPSLTPLGPVAIEAVLTEVAQTMRHHEAIEGRVLDVDTSLRAMVRSHAVILSRVVRNMVTNALEACAPGQTVRVWAEVSEPGKLTVFVHNPGVVPEAVAVRIFQRHFSTKGEAGRGMGTWSMKLLGEDFLHGRVGFASIAEAGTRFWIALPTEPA
jgi:signal transduction histidine kinase